MHFTAKNRRCECIVAIRLERQTSWISIYPSVYFFRAMCYGFPLGKKATNKNKTKSWGHCSMSPFENEVFCIITFLVRNFTFFQKKIIIQFLDRFLWHHFSLSKKTHIIKFLSRKKFFPQYFYAILLICVLYGLFWLLNFSLIWGNINVYAKWPMLMLNKFWKKCQFTKTVVLTICWFWILLLDGLLLMLLSTTIPNQCDITLT